MITTILRIMAGYCLRLKKHGRILSLGTKSFQYGYRNVLHKAAERSRTVVSSLEGWGNSRYTTAADWTAEWPAVCMKITGTGEIVKASPGR